MMRPQRSREAEIFRGNARLETTASKKGTLHRLLTEPQFAVRTVRYLLGLPVPMKTEDRRVLEQVIFPYFKCLPPRASILFVGCDWYTKHYERTYFPGSNYWTIDPWPRARKFAGRQHLVAPLERLDEHFPEGYFDLIVCNGVYGFGLDAREQLERAFALCHSRLAAQGYFLFGWDDIPARTPVPLQEIQSLARFQRFTFPAFGSWHYTTDTPYRHTYDFYLK
jgi:hypothetical protein